jgi:hypothetical protein
MTDTTSPDPVAEARARVRLRHLRAIPVRRPPKTLGLAAVRVVRSKSKRKSTPPLQRLKENWREIVGDAFWAVSRPEKLHKTKHGQTLTLRVLPQAALMVQHQGETLRQRVSVAAGGDISDIRIVQGALFEGRPGPTRRRQRALKPAEQAELDRRTAGIRDPALRAAIVALGAAVIVSVDTD